MNEAIILCPDVAVLDISIPIMDGMETGASGYVLKDDMGNALVAAMRSLHQGNRYFSKQMVELAQLYIK